MPILAESIKTYKTMDGHIDYKGFRIDIVLDDCYNPREKDNLGTIYANCRDYNPDGHNMDEIVIPEGIRGYVLPKSFQKTHIYIQVYAYIHSGICLATRPFSDPWDSGLFGIIAVSKEIARGYFNCKRITKSVRVKILKTLESEIEELNDVYNGRCYGYQIINKDEEEIDSCWGYVGDFGKTAMIEDAKSVIDSL